MSQPKLRLRIGSTAWRKQFAKQRVLHPRQRRELLAFAAKGR